MDFFGKTFYIFRKLSSNQCYWEMKHVSNIQWQSCEQFYVFDRCRVFNIALALSKINMDMLNLDNAHWKIMKFNLRYLKIKIDDLLDNIKSLLC